MLQFLNAPYVFLLPVSYLRLYHFILQWGCGLLLGWLNVACTTWPLHNGGVGYTNEIGIEIEK